MEQEVTMRVPMEGIRILNDESASRLNGMLQSKDPSDHLMAQLILVELDVKESIYYIWKLAHNNSNRMINARTKKGRIFRDACDFWSIAHKKHEAFAVWLNNRGWLSKEIFNKLVPDIKLTIKNDNKNPFYDFYITIKDKYKDLDPEDSLTKLNDLW
jgi:hypothetical protein